MLRYRPPVRVPFGLGPRPLLLSLLVIGGCTDSVAPGEPGPAACPHAPGAIAPSAVRFLPHEIDCKSLPPSLILDKPRPAVGPVPETWAARPELRQSEGTYIAELATSAGTNLYGTGEIAGPLLRDGKITQAWADQTAIYSDQNDHLYQAHPWVLGVRADGSSFGIFADTTYRVIMDLTRGVTLSADEPFPVVVIEGDSPQDVMRELADLTGHMDLPPLWSLGYHQSRFSYTPDDRVREIASELRARKLPADVIWMDIDYMDDFRVFTFDPETFPDPAALNEDLHDQHFKAVWMIDPCVATDSGYHVYDSGTAGDHWVLDGRQGQPFVGKVWPGDCVFPDYTRAETRTWWAGLYKSFLDTGIDGVWNDMNEPSQLKFPASPPESLWHRGDTELPAGLHAQYHNAYGLLMSRASRDGMLAAQPDKRPFLLTRSTLLGGHRYAATWTGDNSSTWPHLYWSVPMVLNLGLSGQPFSGPDIGGFVGSPDPELFAHWMGVGAFFPFSRGHAASIAPDQEPWVFGKAVEDSARTALQRRYRLLPYLYTVFREAAETGLPVMRPLFFADPKDPALREEDHAFLVGDSVLVQPQLIQTANRTFPELPGTWREMRLVGENPALDPAQPVLRVRPGAIVPVGRVVQSTAEPLLEPLTLIVSLDEHGQAEGTLYEDAGDGFAYRDGDFRLTTYRARTENGNLVLDVSERLGERAYPARTVQVEVLTDAGVVRGSGDPTSGMNIPLQ